MFLDCTLRDGGYYNSWDFSRELIVSYLNALPVAGVDVLELGFRTLNDSGYQGPCAFTTDDFLRGLPLPSSVMIGVMVNGGELTGVAMSQDEALERLFPAVAADSPVDLVRVACHVHEFEAAVPATHWLKERGYKVGFNLMQVADRSEEDIKRLARVAAQYPLDVLYFADSFGGMSPEQTAQIIQWIRTEWTGPMGIHTHDNMGLALSNSLRAMDEGVEWIDSTVTGMGRGPGNARTEELAIEMAARRNNSANFVPLMNLLRKHFKPMQAQYGWGTNPFYYLAGKYSIHPTYIQSMIGDARYDAEDVLSVIEHLRVEGGAKFDVKTMDAARQFYGEEAQGTWNPEDLFEDREVLLLGTGPGVADHQVALESFIKAHRPLVVALNTQTSVSSDLIDVRVASHPIRLLADAEDHVRLPQPLIAPYSMLPQDAKNALGDKEVLDFGMRVQSDTFVFGDTHCVTPTSLVLAYAFAVFGSGKAKSLYLAGFDGYPGEDARNEEMNSVIRRYAEEDNAVRLTSITPTRYDVDVQKSVYGLLP